MLKINSGIALTAASILVSAGMIAVLISNTQAATPEAQVKGDSTTPLPISQQKDVMGILSAPNSSSPTPAPPTTATKPTDSKPVTAKQGSVAQNNIPADLPIVIPIVTTPEEPSAPSEPGEPPVPPTPEPSYRIDIREDQVTRVDLTPSGISATQIMVPFDIILDAGFTATNYGQPGCIFLTTPAPSHGVLCNVSQKEAGSGMLVMQYDSNRASGQYLVEISYPIGDTVRTDTYAFELV